ncbi:M48 family metallopeptidase [Vibrio sp. D431a]|uniref:M48 family metallopeptidase n=1 Tax=Vibrio sp. D431a TaxID=2837388 RepID=UPI002553393A|nr:M48 family metalloprotease [Vibrio sp. D431a]MDK9790042.1 M48 family metalloprotease [Vibrio sp. D431a]
MDKFLQKETGVPLWIIALGMFALTILVTYIIAYVSVIIHMLDHLNWWGNPDPQELTWAILTFFSLATLYPLGALIYAFYSISDSQTKKFFDRYAGSRLNEKEEEMFRGFISEASSYTGEFDASTIRKYESADINAWALGTTDAGYMSFSSETLKLPEKEIKGIFYHELGHLVTKDTQKAAFAKAFQEAVISFGLVTPLKNILRYTFFIMTQLVLMKVSRDREYRADQFAIEADPDCGVLGALESIRASNYEVVNPDELDVYMFSLKFEEDSVFATHPTLDNRIIRIVDKKAASSYTSA